MYGGYAGTSVYKFEMGEDVPIGVFPEGKPIPTANSIGCQSNDLPAIVGLKTSVTVNVVPVKEAVDYSCTDSKQVMYKSKDSEEKITENKFNLTCIAKPDGTYHFTNLPDPEPACKVDPNAGNEDENKDENETEEEDSTKCSVSDLPTLAGVKASVAPDAKVNKDTEVEMSCSDESHTMFEASDSDTTIDGNKFTVQCKEEDEKMVFKGVKDKAECKEDQGNVEVKQCSASDLPTLAGVKASVASDAKVNKDTEVEMSCSDESHTMFEASDSDTTIDGNKFAVQCKEKDGSMVFEGIKDRVICKEKQKRRKRQSEDTESTSSGYNYINVKLVMMFHCCKDIKLYLYYV